MHHSMLVVLCLIVLISPKSFAQDQESSSASDQMRSIPIASLEDWATETFALPPSFAPQLPSGAESLLFAPGWRDPESENFWSYAFVMSMNESVRDEQQITEILADYYNGLMSVFASNRNKGDLIKPVRIELVRVQADHYEATIHLVDAFATFKPVVIQVVAKAVAETERHSFVQIQVSKQPLGHEIWKSLDKAIERIQAQSTLLSALNSRSDYAQLDQISVESLAHAAQEHWEQVFSRFTYQGVERFAAGGVSHWMSIWKHNSTGLNFILVPGGKFEMGSPANEKNRNEDELQHWVSLDPFLIAQTECTQEAWATFAKDAGFERDTPKGDPQLPLNGFSPADVDAWCLAADLALPTEAQWEYMCRAGTDSTWTMGDDKEDLVRFGNIGSADCPEDWVKMEGLTESWHDGYGEELAEVAQFSPNAFGLFDVHGNICEWVRDSYVSYQVPILGMTGLRSTTSTDRIARGGNGGGNAAYARSAARQNVGDGVSPGGNKGFGFRPSVDLTH